MASTIALTVAALIIAALSIGMVLQHVTAQTSAPALCMDSETRDKLRALMFEGINTAMVHHTEKLFDNLLKDRGHDPARMTRGMHDSLALYARSRENLLQWSPPPC